MGSPVSCTATPFGPGPASAGWFRPGSSAAAGAGFRPFRAANFRDRLVQQAGQRLRPLGEARLDPQSLEGAQRLADPRPAGDAARDDVGAAERQLRLGRVGDEAAARGEGRIARRRPESAWASERVARGLAPGARTAARASRRASGGASMPCRRSAPRRRREPVVFGVGEPQPFAQALGVFGDRDAERREPQQRVGARRAPPRSRAGG